MRQFSIAVMLTLLLAGRGLGATTYYVATTGSDANTCTQAQSISTPKRNIEGTAGGISCLASGDTLNVRSGSYEASDSASGVSIPNGTNESNRTKIVAYDGPLSVIIFKAVQSNRYLVDWGIYTAQWITVDGFIFDCTRIVDAGGASCIGQSSSAAHQRFQNFEVKNAGLAATGSNTETSCFGVAGTSQEFINGNVHDCAPSRVTFISSGYGFYVGNGTGHTFDRMKIHHNGGWGVHINGTSITNVTIKNSEIYSNVQYATESSGNLIVYGSGHSGHVFDHNIIRDAGSPGGGLSITACSNCIVTNNVFVRNNRYGLEITPSSSGTKVENNIFYNNNTGGGGFPHIDNFGSGTVFATNDCNGTGGTANCALTSDPRFVDATNNDFRLCVGSGNPSANCTVASPAIDQGTDVSALVGCSVGVTCRDFAGTIIPQGAGWEIGALEVGAAPACPAVSPALVAQFSADNVATDSSGNGNHGTLNGVGSGVAYSASGKYGQAFSFAGAGAVTVADANSLDFCGGFTLEAWVKPTNTMTDYVGVIHKDNKYRLYASADPAFCANSGPWTGYSQVPNGLACYGTALPAGVWSHLAATYDKDAASANLKIFLNGVLVTSGNATAALSATTGLVYIGGSNFGEYFTGLIDEIRLYNYALPPTAGTNACSDSPSIMRDMNCAINPAPPAVVRVQLGAVNGIVKLGAVNGIMKIQGQ